MKHLICSVILLHQPHSQTSVQGFWFKGCVAKVLGPPYFVQSLQAPFSFECAFVPVCLLTCESFFEEPSQPILQRSHASALMMFSLRSLTAESLHVTAETAPSPCRSSSMCCSYKLSGGTDNMVEFAMKLWQSQ